MSSEIEDRFTRISTFIEFLNNINISIQDLTKFLALKTFNSYGAFAVYMMRLNTEAQLELMDSFGQTDEQRTGWRVIPLSQEVPATDAVKEDRLIWIADHADWEHFYPHLIEYPDSTNLRTLINAPLYMTGAPIGVLGVMCEKEVKPAPEDISFVDIISGLVSLHVSKQQNRNIQLEERGAYLTKRQVTIIDMMSRQMTNMQIARELGYSESTVRHETMRIYETLQANGRREAVALARKLGLIK